MTTTLKGGQLARLAGQLCAQRHFQQWLGAESTEHAAAIVRGVCQVESRAQLDHDDEARARFHKHIRGPWVKGARFESEVAA